MSVPYLDHFLDSLDTLPSDLQRNFVLMKDLDTRTQDIIKKINKQAEEYVRNVAGLDSSSKTENFKQIREMFEKSMEFSDDKVQLAMQTYEMVDKHIRRLDAELTKFEADMQEKQISCPPPVKVEDVKKKGRAGASSSSTAVKSKSMSFNPKNVIKDENEKGSTRKKQKKQEVESVTLATTVTPSTSIMGSIIVSPTDVLDMPVDPNEPTYCLCHQVSYGEMIGCDNSECPIEWFHFACVGLTSKPKGKWFCPKCIGDRKKK